MQMLIQELFGIGIKRVILNQDAEINAIDMNSCLFRYTDNSTITQNSSTNRYSLVYSVDIIGG